MSQRVPERIAAAFRRFRGKPRIQRTRIIVLGAAFLFHLLLIALTPQFGAFFSRFRLADFEIGGVAPRDLYADKDITYINADATLLRREAVASLVSPVFVINEDLSRRSLQRFTDFSVLFAEARTKSSSAANVYLEVQAHQPGLFSLDQITRVLETGNVLANLNESRLVLDLVLNRGVVGDLASIGDSGSDTFEVIREIDGDRSRSIVPASSIVALSSIRETTYSELVARSVDEKNHQVISDIVVAFAEENAFYEPALTADRREQALKEVDPVVSKLIKGERIARMGMIVSQDDMKKISALAEYSTTVNFSRVIGSAFFVILLYTFAFFLLSPPISRDRLLDRNVLLLVGISILHTGLAVALTRITGLNIDVPFSVFLPTALLSMLISILINQRTSVVISLMIGLSLLPLSNMDPYPALFAFFSGLAATFVVGEAQKRLDLIRATVFLAFAGALIMGVLSILKNLDLSRILVAFGWGFLNGFVCGILTLGILPFLEHLMNASTPFRLIELSDLNSSIMKRMLTLAPGTYGHSVAVANLAESACREIGANPLLARVGAYYHDIGKIDQAEYFVENQTDENKLNELKPSLSVAVIKSHVKIGVEKGKELGLPPEVVQIISQHHGSGLISYFYAQAKKTKGESVSPADFSYTGIPPVSKEAAVVMLADGVEASARTLKKPSVAKLERFVWERIQERFSSQQMSNCELTFRDLELIKQSFVHILAGYFHSRIEYPEIDEHNGKSK